MAIKAVWFFVNMGTFWPLYLENGHRDPLFFSSDIEVQEHGSIMVKFGEKLMGCLEVMRKIVINLGFFEEFYM